MSKQIGKYGLYTLLLFFCVSPAFSQELYYDVYRGENSIGFLKVNKDCQGSTCTYTLENEVNISMVITVKVELLFKSVFKNGKLVYAETTQKRNDKVKEETKLTLHGSKYLYTKGSQETWLNIAPMSYTTILMYHEEPPSGTKQVFSERFGEMLNLEHVPHHTYKLHLANGTMNEFDYTARRCTRIQLHHTLSKIDMELRQGITTRSYQVQE